MLSGMERGTKRLMRLVEDLMLLMRIESGAAEVEIKRYRTHTDLSLLITEVVTMYSGKAESHNVQIELSVPDDLSVYCVPVYLQDAVGRLLDNAIKFSRIQGGRVVVVAERHGKNILISVQDEGIGIEGDQQQHLFQRFQQVDRDKMEQQGLGLGLAIAGGLAQLHHGSISLVSEPGVGSTFTISLPVQDKL